MPAVRRRALYRGKCSPGQRIAITVNTASIAMVIDAHSAAPPRVRRQKSP
jgi:hypothetical protein